MKNFNLLQQRPRIHNIVVAFLKAGQTNRVSVRENSSLINCPASLTINKIILIFKYLTQYSGYFITVFFYFTQSTNAKAIIFFLMRYANK